MCSVVGQLLHSLPVIAVNTRAVVSRDAIFKGLGLESLKCLSRLDSLKSWKLSMPPTSGTIAIFLGFY